MIDTLSQQRTNMAMESFVGAARTALGDSLRAIVLYGSAAEDAVRARSDINVLVVLHRFEPVRIDALRDTLRALHAAVRLDAMFLLEDEIEAAAQAFPVKFFDVLRRHRVAYGDDPFAGVAIGPDVIAGHLKQLLLNMILRWRNAYATRAAREEQLPALLAAATGPLRASAAALLSLRGEAVASPKAALQRVVDGWSNAAASAALTRFSGLREGGALAPGEGEVLLLTVIDMAGRMRAELGA